MSLTAIYERFIASPNPISLADNASLHYIPTLTTHSGPGSIIRHLENQNKNVVKIRSAKPINAVEGQNAVAVEVETVLEFISGGGAYLPKLENFVADKMATLPITHIVLFDSDQKISQIRLMWDQATLLMQADVIGARGQNWPIVDGKDQIRLIVSSKSAAPVHTPSSPISPRGRGTQENGFTARNPSPNKKHIKDPYASLDLFGPQKSDENRPASSSAQGAPRASAKPPPREMSELFAAGHEDLEEKPGSPKKSYANPAVAPKGAGGRNFGANRVFDDEEDNDNNTTSPKGYKTNPARYNHFDIGDEDDNDSFQYRGSAKSRPAQAIPMRAKTDKHGSQWDFADFVTPAKQPVKVRAQDKVNFDLEDDKQENSPGKVGALKARRDAEPHFEFKDDGTPVDRHAVPKPRKDAQTHFAFEDEPTPAPRRIIARTEAARGLYRELPNESDEKPPLQSISANARNSAFGSQWDMTDDSPVNTRNKEKGVSHQSENRKKADSHWESYDESPNTVKRPVSKGQTRAMQAHWSIGGDEEDEQAKPAAAVGSTGGKKGFWDF